MAGSDGITAAIRNQYEAMSPRDRRLLAGLAGFFALVFCLLLYFVLSGALDDKASRVRAQKDALELIQVAAAEYNDAAQRIEAAEARLRRYQGQNFKPFVEQEASKLGVQMGPITDQGSEVLGSVKQTTFKVELKKMELEVCLDFLHALETSGYPLHVEMAKFKRITSREEKLINLTLEVVAFSLVGGGEG